MIKNAESQQSLKKFDLKRKSNQSSCKESSNKQSEFFKSHTFQNLNSPFPTSKSQSHGSCANHIHQMRKSATNLLKHYASNLNQSTKHKKNLSMKCSISTNKLQSHKDSQTMKFSKINDEGLHTIKIESKENRQLSENKGKLTSSVKRSSKLFKKSTKQNGKINNNTANNTFGEIATKSEIYEDFFRQSDVSQKQKDQETAREIQNKLQNTQNQFYLTQSYYKLSSNNLICVKQSEISNQFDEDQQSKSIQAQQKSIETKQNLFSVDSQQNIEKIDKIELSPSQNEILVGSGSDNQQQELKQLQKPRIPRQKKIIEDAEELFRKLSREIASKKQKQMFEKKFQNFYDELRFKMMRKYDLMMKDYRLDDKQRVKIQMLIEGCNLEKHRRIDRFKQKNKTQPPRPETAKAVRQASKDIYHLNHIQKKNRHLNARPFSSQPKSTRSYDQSLKMVDYISNQIKFRKERKHQSQAIGHQKSQSCTFFFMTNTNLQNFSLTDQKSNQLLRKTKSRQNFVKQRNLLSNKFSLLIDICEGQSTQHEQTKKKMQAFEYFCSKVDNGFQKKSKQIHNSVFKL